MNKIPVITVPMESLAEVIVLQLEKGGRARLAVTGSSMMPLFYSRRDAVMLVPADDPQKKGEVILYRRANGRYVLHRIIKAKQDHYICCGDNQYEEEIVTHDQLIGVVDSFERNGKNYSRDHWLYRIYQTLWVELFFLRPGYIWLRRRLGRLCWKIRSTINRRKV